MLFFDGIKVLASGIYHIPPHSCGVAVNMWSMSLIIFLSTYLHLGSKKAYTIREGYHLVNPLLYKVVLYSIIYITPDR